MKRVIFVVALLLVTACEKQEAVYSGPGGEQRMDFAIPAALDDKAVDLNNPQAVAKALHIRLTGDTRQKLYDIVMTAPDSDRKMVKRTIEIRVDNIRQGSALIYSAGGARYEPPKNVAKPSAPKRKKKVTKK